MDSIGLLSFTKVGFYLYNMNSSVLVATRWCHLLTHKKKRKGLLSLENLEILIITCFQTFKIVR